MGVRGVGGGEERKLLNLIRISLKWLAREPILSAFAAIAAKTFFLLTTFLLFSHA
jgi:hypothetical protein